jgi:hypothetical protein
VTPEVKIAALCDHAIVGQDGKLSMLGIFRNISVSQLPAQHPRMFLVAVLALEPGPHNVVVRLVRPDGAAAMAEDPHIQVHSVPGQDVNVIVELNNLGFSSYGTHHFDVDVDGSTIESLPVAISPIAAQATRQN